jgi:hypothetical protein
VDSAGIPERQRSPGRDRWSYGGIRSRLTQKVNRRRGALTYTRNDVVLGLAIQATLRSVSVPGLIRARRRTRQEKRPLSSMLVPHAGAQPRIHPAIRWTPPGGDGNPVRSRHDGCMGKRSVANSGLSDPTSPLPEKRRGFCWAGAILPACRINLRPAGPAAVVGPVGSVGAISPVSPAGATTRCSR